MRTNQPVGTPLETRLNEIPQDRMSPEVRANLAHLCQGFDQVARIDDKTGKVYLDEDQMRQQVNTYCSSSFTDQFMTKIKSSPDSYVMQTGSSEAVTPITWLEFVSHVGLQVPPGDTLQGIGLNGSSTEEDFKRAIQQHFPQFPKALFDKPTAVQFCRNLIEARLPASVSSETGNITSPEIEALSSNCFWNCWSGSVPGWLFLQRWDS